MSINPLRNVTIDTFRDFLKWEGLQKTGTNGGHEKWSKDGLLRPVIIQSHKKIVPERIVKNTLDNIGSSKERFIEFLKS